ncbi:hypothetical protein BGZ82_010931 [Podila clonocystis]|nr:hypothetical protein BGZ82_010931 [Podila clonocystis]
MSANARRTTRPPSSTNESGSGDPYPPAREASPVLSTPQDPIDSADPADDAPVKLEHSATHIVVEHTRDGTVKTHVYAAKGNGQPADLHESVLGHSALPQGDPTWSSHAPRTDHATGEDDNPTSEAIDLAAVASSVTAALTASATETRTALSETLLGASGDICKAIDLSVQETVAAFRTTHAEALSMGESRAEQVLSAAATAEMDQLRGQLVPRLDEIVQYVSSAAPRMEEIAQYVSSTAAAVERVERAVSASRGDDGSHDDLAVHSRSMPGIQSPSIGSSSRAGHFVHGSEEVTTSMAFMDPEVKSEIDTAASAVSGVQEPEILDKMAGIENKIDTIETKINTIYRVVVDGEMPDSVPQLSDPAGSGAHLAGGAGGTSALAPTPEEAEALSRMEAMRREMVAFPDSTQLQLMNENMEALRLALEKNVPVANTKDPVDQTGIPVTNAGEGEVQAPAVVPDEEEIARNRVLQEEETRWKDYIEGSHTKHHELIELLGAKIDGSSHTSKMAMKTFWVFMRLLFQHAKDMGSKMDLLQRDFENRTTQDHESHLRMSGMLTSIQSDLQTLARQLPESLTDSAEIQRIVDQTVAGIQSSLVFASVPPVTSIAQLEDAAAEEAVSDGSQGAQDAVADTHADPSVARSRSLPIPGPDISPVPFNKNTVSEETSRAGAPTTVATDAIEVEPTTQQELTASHEHDLDPQLMFPQVEELVATIKSLQEHMAAMTAQYADLYTSVNRNSPPRGASLVVAAPAALESVQEVPSEEQDAVDDEAQETPSSTLLPPPPPGKPAEGYGPIPRSLAPPLPSLTEEPVMEEMGSPAEVPNDPTEEFAARVAPSISTSVTLQDLERMNELLGRLTGLVTTSAIEIKSGQKSLHNELQAEVGKVLHALNKPREELETEMPEQQQEREEKDVQARAIADEESQRKADEYVRSLEHISMIPNLTAALQSVNDHLANKMNMLREDVAGVEAQTREQVQIVHQDVRKLITGSIEDSGTLDMVRTVLEGLAAQHATRSEELMETLAEAAKRAEVHELFQELKIAHETTLAQHQEAILDKLEEWCKGHGEHCEVVEDWHRRHDSRGEATEKWHESQDERYKGFDQWRLLYNDQCAGEDMWRQRVDGRHIRYEELQKKSIELLERIEQVPKCQCVPVPSEPTPANAEACTEEEACTEGEAGAESRSVADSNGHGPEDTDTPAGDRELAENPAISSAASSSSATTTCPSTPNRQRRARELYNLFQSFMNEVAPGHGGNCCGLPSCGNRSIADHESLGMPGLNNENNERPASHCAPLVNVMPPSEGSKHEEDGESSDRRLDEGLLGLNEHTSAVETLVQTDYCRELYEMLLPHFAPKEHVSSGARSEHGCAEAEGAGASSAHTAYPADAANEAKEVVIKQLADLQEQYDVAIADNEELRTQNTGMVSTILDKDRMANALMDDKVKLEEQLQERDEQLAKQKEKHKEAKRAIERLYRDELGLGELLDVAMTEDPALSRRHLLVKQASEQLRQTVDEFEERHAILSAEISALEDQKTLLQRQIAAMTPPPPVPLSYSHAPTSFSSRRTGVRARGERESVSEDESVHVQATEVVDTEEACVEVEDTSKKGSGSGRSPLSMAGSSSARQVSVGTSGSAGSPGSRPITRQGKRAAGYSRSQSQGPKRRSGGEAVYSLLRVPQLEADIKICKDGLLSETLLSSKTVLTEEQLAKVRMAKKSMEDEDEEDGGVEEVWSLSCNFRVNLVPSP